MKEEIEYSLLVKFLKKGTTEEENLKIKDWVSESEENRKKFREVHETFHFSQLKEYQSRIEIENAWNKLCSQMPRTKSHTRKIQLNSFWRVAASIAVVVTIGLSGFWLGNRLSFQKNNNLVQVEAPAGEKSKILLADGTYVWLNSSSVLSYKTSDPRKVSVDGEAYFDVKKDKAHPFKVTTQSGLTITVLGTKFNLKSYESEDLVETTLDEGKIAITGAEGKEPVILNPGQQANYNIQGNSLEVKTVDASIYSVWRNNVLRFSDISFGDLIPRIERWYGVTIDLDPNINAQDRFTMTIKTESLRELLNMMQLTSNFNYEINGEKVKIMAR